MNIAIVIESLHCGGAEKSLVSMLNIIDFKKHHVELLLLKKGGEFERLVPKGIKITYLTKSEKRYQSFISKIYFRLQTLLFKNKLHGAQIFWKAYGKRYNSLKNKYDLAIAYNQGFATYFVSEKINSERKYSWLNTDYKRAGYHFPKDQPYYSKMNAVVCVSNANKEIFESIAHTYNYEPKTIVIPDMIDTTVVNRLGKESIVDFDGDFLKILTVGRLAEAKNITLAIEVCSRLIKNNFNLKWYVIGEGPKEQDLRGKIKKKGLQDHFILLGFRDNPYPYIRKCDIYVQPSSFEGLGISVIEAKLFRKPIIITKFSTSKYLIEPLKNGIISETSADSLYECLVNLIQDEKMRKVFTRNLESFEYTQNEQSKKNIQELLAL